MSQPLYAPNVPPDIQSLHNILWVRINIHPYSFPTRREARALHLVNSPREHAHERLSVADAAKLLNITPEAVRQRIRRGTIEHEQTAEGRYFVYVTPSEDVENNVENNIGNADLRDYVETLKRELEIRNEELRRKDHIIMSLTQRIPELEPASEPREPPESASEEQGSTMTPTVQDEPESATQRPWWRRLIGG
jgi:hypothetical protein